MAVRSSLYGVGYGDSNINTVFAQNQSLPFNSLLAYGSSDLIFQGSGSQSMFKFGHNNAGKRSERPFFCTYDEEDINAEDYSQPEKKKRLKVDQIKYLEKSFEEDNRLEPDRKVQLAIELGLQPRQIAIWFQNRRARWKTKQIEKDYDVLQAKYNNLEADYDKLFKEKEKLKDEVHFLTSRLLLDEKEKGNSDIECVIEPVESSNVYGSDIISRDDDNLNMTAAYAFEKLENGLYSDNPAESCQFGFLDGDDDGDQDAFGF